MRPFPIYRNIIIIPTASFILYPKNILIAISHTWTSIENIFPPPLRLLFFFLWHSRLRRDAGLLFPCSSFSLLSPCLCFFWKVFLKINKKLNAKSLPTIERLFICTALFLLHPVHSHAAARVSGHLFFFLWNVRYHRFCR